MKKNTHQGIQAVVMGGGTGTFTVLSSLKHYVHTLSAVINMVDDGGSTGVLRDELGALPPGDVRQCLVALSSSSETMRELFNYRFPNGTFQGHAFGNLFITALEKITGNFADAVTTASEILHITGEVVPVTVDNVRLCVKRDDGKIIKGQKMMIKSDFIKGEKKDFFLEPKGRLNPAAKKAILEADMIILGPGNLHSSLIPLLLVEGMREALWETRAKKIFISNLMTQPGQTGEYSVTDFVDEIEKYAGENVFDYVIYNNKKPPQRLIEQYLKEGEQLVSFDESVLRKKKYHAIGEDLVSSKAAIQRPGDTVHRPLIRHDGQKLSQLVMKLYFS